MNHVPCVRHSLALAGFAEQTPNREPFGRGGLMQHVRQRYLIILQDLTVFRSFSQFLCSSTMRFSDTLLTTGTQVSKGRCGHHSIIKNTGRNDDEENTFDYRVVSRGFADDKPIIHKHALCKSGCSL